MIPFWLEPSRRNLPFCFPLSPKECVVILVFVAVLPLAGRKGRIESQRITQPVREMSLNLPPVPPFHGMERETEGGR